MPTRRSRRWELPRRFQELGGELGAPDLSLPKTYFLVGPLSIPY